MAEPRAAQKQLASFRAVLLSQEVRLGLPGRTAASFEECHSACIGSALFALFQLLFRRQSFSRGSTADRVTASAGACGDLCVDDTRTGETPTKYCGTQSAWAVYAHSTSCAQPVVQNQGINGSCLEVPTILHGGTCTPRCADKYVPSHLSLTCQAGRFVSAPTFTCIEVFGKCTAPEVQNQGEYGSCSEGVNLGQMKTCTIWCHPYCQPSIATLSAVTACWSRRRFSA